MVEWWEWEWEWEWEWSACNNKIGPLRALASGADALERYGAG